MKIEDELRTALNRRASSVTTDDHAAWAAFERRAQRMDRSRRVATALVALVVAISAFALVIRAFRPAATTPGGAGQPSSVSVTPHSSSASASGSGAPSESSSNPLDRPKLEHVQVIPQQVVGSSPDFLIVEAPVGEVRWKMTSDCEFTDAPVGGSIAGGFGGAGCQGGALATGGIGGARVAGTFYDVIGGHAYFGQEVTMRVTFVDGKTVEVVTRNGLWMVVLKPQPESYSPASHVATVEAISSTGQVLGRTSVP
jgi:hypothetical protein